MIVNMSATATKEQINHVMDRIKECGFLPHLIQGAERTVIGVVGKNRGRRSEIESLRVAPGVEDIIPISQPFTLVSLELQPKRTVVDVSGVQIGGAEHRVVAAAVAVGVPGAFVEYAGGGKSTGARELCGRSPESR